MGHVFLFICVYSLVPCVRPTSVRHVFVPCRAGDVLILCICHFFIGIRGKDEKRKQIENYCARGRCIVRCASQQQHVPFLLYFPLVNTVGE